ncbi:MAG TPA: phospholipid carrier-dependent glycosyltransferase, partial [Cyanothece sp. UBA12306]|nr:phospholipid carrier-dependent glycosyltransferase [Cyanothece sp. UBA12306]
LTIFCLLRSRRDLRWSLGVGLSLSCLLLTHSVIGLVLGLIVLSFVAWDTPRLLTSGYFWLGIGLGLLPAISWYGEQYTNYGYPRLYSLFIQPFKEDQGIFGRLLGIQGLELVKSSLPWLIFTLYGCYLARKNLVWGWAKLILVWGGVYLIIFTLLPLPNIGYLTPLYPPLALAGGIALADVYHSPVDRPYPKLWGMILFGLSVGISLVGFSFWLNFPLDLSHLSHRFLLILTLGAIALTFLTTAILITQRDPQFIIILFWGMYVSLLLLVNSPYWNGIMVSNQYVQPLAAMLSDRVPVDQVIYADFSEEDPVLNFYSDRQVIPATPEKLLRYWHILEQPYLLINLDTWQKLPLESVHPLDQSPPNWYLITRLKSQDNSEKKIEQL